jgi:hypothetical protein
VDYLSRLNGTEKALQESIGWNYSDKEWEQAKLVDPNIQQRCGLYGELADKEQNIWKAITDPESEHYSDTHWAVGQLADAKANLAYGFNLLENDDRYKDIFESWDEAKKAKEEDAELFTICYLEHSMLRADPPLDKYGEIDWDEYTRQENALFAQYPADFKDKVYYVLEKKKGQEEPWAVMEWLDTKKLGDAGYFDLPSKQIKSMDEEDIKDLNPDIYATQIAQWKTYNEAVTDADKQRVLELYPDLEKDWRGEFLLNNPDLEAGVVFWRGRTQFSSMAALETAWKKVEELGLDKDQFMAGLNMPPKELWDTADAPYWKYVEYSTNNETDKLNLLIATNEPLRTYLQTAFGTYKNITDTPIEVLQINDKWTKEDDEYDAIEANAKLGISEATADIRRASYLVAHPEYAKDRRVRDAYGLGLADWAIRNGIDSKSLVNAYAEYYVAGGKREGWADDRFLMEHMELYNALIDLEIWKEKIDFTEVPTVEVEKLYNEYLDLPSGIVRLNFRQHHPDLDAWLVNVKGLKPIGDRAKGEVEPPPNVPIPPP